MARTLSINEFNNQVHLLQINLPLEITSINRKLALTAIDLITNRLVDEGVTGEGKSLGQYSEKKISPGFFIGGTLGAGADGKIQNYLKQQKKAGGVPGISYKTVRELNGLPTKHVTLSFSNDTMDDIGILEEVNTGKVVKTSVGSKNSKTKKVYNAKGKETGTVGTGDVLDQLSDKYGDILSLNAAEEEILAHTLNAELQTFLDKIFE